VLSCCVWHPRPGCPGTSLPGRGRGHFDHLVAAACRPRCAHRKAIPPRMPILRRRRADRADNREPGTRPDPGEANQNHGRTPLAVHSLAQGPRRREIACAPIPHRRRGLDDRTDPGPLGAPATRLRSALRRGQVSLRRSRGKGGSWLGKKGLDRWSAIRQLNPSDSGPLGSSVSAGLRGALAACTKLQVRAHQRHQ